MNKFLLCSLIWVVAYLSGSLLLDKKADAPLAFTLPANQFLLHSGETLIIEEHSAPQIIQPEPQIIEIEEPPMGIRHLGFDIDDPRQRMVAEAYDSWGLEFVSLIECENWLWNPKAVGDNGLSFWLCQLNIRRHWEPLDPDWESWVYQLNVCHGKRESWTKFYWPTRKVNGKACLLAVQERFEIHDFNSKF